MELSLPPVNPDISPNVGAGLAQPTIPPTPTILPPEPVPASKKSKKKLLFVLGAVFFFLLLVLITAFAADKQTPRQPSPSPVFHEIPDEEWGVKKTASPSASPLIDYSKWKNWNDPNGFTLFYPPNAKAKYLNNNTIVTGKSDYGSYTISFCKNCVKDACNGTCDNEKDITIIVGEQKYAEKQISPDNNGNFTFRVVIPYPNTYTREKLVIFGNYLYEESLSDIQTILSSFKFIAKKDNF